MKQQVTTGIVLSRTNYGEADRILTLLTHDQGKIRLLAKGVRKIKSRMAGGIELFSVNDITYLVGRGDLGTLISSRLIKNYGNIVKDIDRTMYAYEILKTINKITEDSPEPEYFEVLNKCLVAVNEDIVSIDCVRLWLQAQLLKIGGHLPNLTTNKAGKVLAVTEKYMFNFDDMTFSTHQSGPYGAAHIKLLRLSSSLDSPVRLAIIEETDKILPSLAQLTKILLKQHSNI